MIPPYAVAGLVCPAFAPRSRHMSGPHPLGNSRTPKRTHIVENDHVKVGIRGRSDCDKAITCDARWRAARFVNERRMLVGTSLRPAEEPLQPIGADGPSGVNTFKRADCSLELRQLKGRIGSRGRRAARGVRKVARGLLDKKARRWVESGIIVGQVVEAGK